MNFAALSNDWSVQSKHSALRLLRRLRRQVRLCKRSLARLQSSGVWSLGVWSSGEWLGWFQPDRFLLRITVGRLAQIDRTAQMSAPVGSLIQLGDMVQLGRQTRLSARQEGEIILEPAVSLGQETEIIAQAGCVEIGSATSLGSLCRLFSSATLKIGRNCQFGDRVTLHAQPISPFQAGSAEANRLGPAVRPGSLRPDSLRPVGFRSISLKPASMGTGSILIEDHCWIGNNVQIAAGVTIGQHSVIGDDAVVLSDVPAFSVATGSPAKIRSGALREVVTNDSLTSDYKTLSQLALKSYLNQLSQR